MKHYRRKRPEFPPCQIAFVCHVDGQAAKKYISMSRKQMRIIMRNWRHLTAASSRKNKRKVSKANRQLHNMQWRMYWIAYPYSR